MLRIETTLDVAAFEKSTDAAINDGVIPTLADALNGIADTVVERLVEAQPALLDRPTDFTQRAWKVLPAKAIAGRAPEAWVVMQPIQAEYMEYVIDGGVHRAGDYAATKLGPLIPGRDAPVNKNGNLPRNYVRRMLQDPDVAWVHLTPGKPPVLIRHRKGHDVEILALIAEKAVNHPKFLVYDIIAQTVDVLTRGMA